MNLIKPVEAIPFNELSRSFQIKEKTPQYTKHDQLFKQLIRTFFKEFLEAFFPEIHEQVDFQFVKFLSEEVFTDLIDGEKRQLDIVVEVKWKETDTLIVVHVEPQSYVQANFNKRMFKYFSLLYNKLVMPIIPIAIFSYEEDWEEDDFNMQFSNLNILRFHYLTLHLRKQNWHKFMKKDNPVSAALLSKMGYSEDERVQVKLEFMRILTRLKLNEAEHRLLYGFFETYLKLTAKEEEIFMKEAKELENAEEILEIPISYEERGKEKGREEGLKEGLEKGKIEVALKMLKRGFSIKEIAELTQLDRVEIEGLKEQL
ncbi:Rpn family recombination-promoting nuclease/putative transposase [Pseudogracilibacillus sp. SO30301A]|uniref:Rpn family recombination-promoting nuclease/putative transposase n=1 Tax=Pseudogracilibacillus sp. SO30301A TaxID=3098291 RepID=UPI00300E393E